MNSSKIYFSRYFVMLIIVIASCQSNQNCTIIGFLPDDSYNGEYIYMVPFFEATKSRVDSTIIKEGKFSIKCDGNTPEIFILRTKPILRLELQELLIVKESGIINVSIGTTSSAHGTALNDSLQSWKQKKMNFDQRYSELKYQNQDTNDSFKNELKQESDSMNVRIIAYNFNFVKNNIDNVVGKMVYDIMKHTFTLEQLDELKSQEF